MSFDLKLPFIIAGPCVIEDERKTLTIAERLKAICDARSVHLIFKASYDKANRSSGLSYRGPGIDRGLAILKGVKDATGLQVLSDVHEVWQVERAAEILDVIQIPAFLCRQTDLIINAAETGKPLNLKKGQFMSPANMIGAIGKAESTGNRKIMVTERGTCFGYNDLVVDFRSFRDLAQMGYPVVFDVTHSLQHPGGKGTRSGGDSIYAGDLARAAAATGFVSGFFFEVHPNPEQAPSDPETSLSFGEFETILDQIRTGKQWNHLD